MKNRLNRNLIDSVDDSGTPMDGVSNMSDAMLVLAVGIMLALVINWKIDIKEVYIGNDVMIGPNTTITTVGHPINPKGRRERLRIASEIKIGNDVWIGANVCILPGITIGNNVVIGAGAVVTQDIPDNSLAVDVPAKVVREIENNISE